MKPLKYKVSLGTDDFKQQSSVEVDGFEAFEMFGLKFGVAVITDGTKHGEFLCWEVTELSTGFRIPFNYPIYDAEEAIAVAKRVLIAKGEETTHKAIEWAQSILDKKETV